MEATLPLKIRIRNYVACFLCYIILRDDGTVNRLLLNFLEHYVLAILPNPTPRYGVVSSDHSVDPDRNLWFRMYTPPSTGLPVIVYFHGGGFALLSPKTKDIDAFCRRLAGKLPAVVISVNYRLSPEYRFPCQYNDGLDALRYIDGIELRNGDLGRCYLAGDSAGGNLAHHVAFRVSGSRFRRIRIRGIVSMQPFFGGEERTESDIRFGNDPSSGLSLRTADIFWKAFLPVGSDRNHPAAHVFGSESGVDLMGIEYPPTLVFIGGRDLLRDWQRKYTDWLVRSGKEVRVVEYPNMFHGFYVVPELPEVSMLVDEVRDFIQLQK